MVNVEPIITSWFGKQLSGKIQEKKEIINDEIITTPILIREANNNGKITERKILPNNEVAIIFYLDGAIPFWQGNIQLDMKVNAIPLVDFETDTDLNPSIMNFTTNFFIIPWNIIIAILVILIILWLLIIFKSKGKESKKTSAKKEEKKKK